MIIRRLICLIFLTLTFSAWAEGQDYWACSAQDGEERQWHAKSFYELTAINKAFEQCKKESRRPITCKAAKAYCEYYAHGATTRPMWRCTALDQMAKPWISNLYAHRDDAALAAKAYCQQHSAMPDSCYINLMTCKNLNEKI